VTTASVAGSWPIAETSYGVAKRLAVVEAWVGDVARRMGRPRLEILDYGCGTGTQITAPLARLGHSVLGVDMHAPSIAAATATHAIDGLSFRTADAAGLVDDRLQFDVVICSEVLEHVHDPAAFLGQLRALARDRGAVVITTPNGYGAYELLSSAQRALQRVGIHQLLRWTVWRSRQILARLRGRPVPSRPLEYLASSDEVGFINVESGHVQFFRLRSLEALFANAGLRIVERRARTALCGPYVDVLFELAPNRDAWLRWNNRIADRLPFAWAADWMFLLEPIE